MGKLDQIGSLRACHAQESQWNVQILADRYGASVSTLERHLRKQHGMGAKEWLVRQKMARALELLRQGYGVEQAALEMKYHYKNTHNFSRDFKRMFGYPSSQHNRRNRAPG